ncbi:unnamed protein product, partial [Prorocentrum cordatum]
MHHRRRRHAGEASRGAVASASGGERGRGGLRAKQRTRRAPRPPQELRARDVSEAQARNQDSTRSSSSPAHMEEDDEEAGLIWTRDKGSDDGLDSKDNAAPRQAQASDGWIKWAAAATLLVQNSGTNLIMPLAQMTEWNSQSGVINQELGKLVVSAAALVWGGGLPNLAAAARPTPEALKTAVPALCGGLCAGRRAPVGP